MTTTDSPNVAFLGLGAMGFAMSTHLVKQGIPITGFDIWKPTLEKFEKACASIPGSKAATSTSPAEAVKNSPIILIMVATHHHVNSALFDAENGAIKTIPQSATVIITSTVPPTYPAEVRHRLDNEFSRPDIKLIDAPVSGGTVRSANGTLTIMSSTDDPSNLTNPTVATILNNLSTNGKTLYTIPGTLGSGTSAKALNQVQCGIHIVGGSEIMALAALNSLNTRSFFNAMKSPDPRTGKSPRYGWTWMFENRGPRMLDPNLPISSAISIINKDVGIIRDEETRLNIILPLINQAQAVLASTMESGMAAIDDAYINTYYLGLNTPRQNLVVDQTKSTTTTSSEIPTSQHESLTNKLLLSHAIINFMSAYETFMFAEALELLGPKQREMWFSIIAGAAGGSTVFSEVIPRAFGTMPDWKVGFREYAVEIFGSGREELSGVESIITNAQAQNVDPVLLRTAYAFLREQLA